MEKQIKIRVYPDGRLESETVGIKGKSCMNYIKDIEDMTGAKVTKSELTHEYKESETAENTVSNEGYQQSGY